MDLLLGRHTRTHGDIDIGVFRSQLIECLHAIGAERVFLCSAPDTRVHGDDIATTSNGSVNQTTTIARAPETTKASGTGSRPRDTSLSNPADPIESATAALSWLATAPMSTKTPRPVPTTTMMSRIPATPSALGGACQKRRQQG